MKTIKEELKKQITNVIDCYQDPIDNLIEENNKLKYALRSIADAITSSISNEESRKNFYDKLNLKYSAIESERIIYEFCCLIDDIKAFVDEDIFNEFFKFDLKD